MFLPMGRGISRTQHCHPGKSWVAPPLSRLLRQGGPVYSQLWVAPPLSRLLRQGGLPRVCSRKPHCSYGAVDASLQLRSSARMQPTASAVGGRQKEEPAPQGRKKGKLRPALPPLQRAQRSALTFEINRKGQARLIRPDVRVLPNLRSNFWLHLSRRTRLDGPLVDRLRDLRSVDGFMVHCFFNLWVAGRNRRLATARFLLSMSEIAICRQSSKPPQAL
jgi:hypothetical protein